MISTDNGRKAKSGRDDTHTKNNSKDNVLSIVATDFYRSVNEDVATLTERTRIATSADRIHIFSLLRRRPANAARIRTFPYDGEQDKQASKVCLSLQPEAIFLNPTRIHALFLQSVN